jgi:hypothetical protein
VPDSLYADANILYLDWFENDGFRGQTPAPLRWVA